MTTEISANLNQTITYQEAAKILGCSLGSLRSMVHQKRLTKVFTHESVGLLIIGQVLLFKNKKQVRFNMLSSDEKEQWEFYRKNAEECYKTKSTTKEVVSQDDPFNPILEFLKRCVSASKEGIPMPIGS